MKKALNTFSNGMDRDTSVNKYSNKNYFEAVNMRLLTNDDLSNGALSLINGTNKKVSFASTDKVIGYTTIRDWIIFFVYNPGGGRIYKFVEDGTTDEQYLTLIYTSEDLKFIENSLIRAIGLYETDKIQKIYFTDGETFFYHLNIYSETYPISNVEVPVEQMKLVSNVTFNKINTKISTGGDLKTGRIQYAYQLYNKNGSETMFSPASKVISLTSSSENVPDTFNYTGSNKGDPVNKSISVTIQNNFVQPDPNSPPTASIYLVDFTSNDKLTDVTKGSSVLYYSFTPNDDIGTEGDMNCSVVLKKNTVEVDTDTIVLRAGIHYGGSFNLSEMADYDDIYLIQITVIGMIEYIDLTIDNMNWDSNDLNPLETHITTNLDIWKVLSIPNWINLEVYNTVNGHLVPPELYSDNMDIRCNPIDNNTTGSIRNGIIELSNSNDDVLAVINVSQDVYTPAQDPTSSINTTNFTTVSSHSSISYGSNNLTYSLTPDDSIGAGTVTCSVKFFKNGDEIGNDTIYLKAYTLFGEETFVLNVPADYGDDYVIQITKNV